MKKHIKFKNKEKDSTDNNQKKFQPSKKKKKLSPYLKESKQNIAKYFEEE